MEDTQIDTQPAENNDETPVVSTESETENNIETPAEAPKPETQNAASTAQNEENTKNETENNSSQLENEKQKTDTPSSENNNSQKEQENETPSKTGIMNWLLNIAENLSKKFEKLPDNHPLKKSTNSIISRIQMTQSNDSLLPPPILPNETKKNSLVALKEKLGPEKWAKRAEKIKRNLEKLTIHAANISTKLLVWGTTLAGKTVKWSGRAVKAAGFGIRTVAWAGKIASWGVEYAGKGLKLLGKGLESGGKALAQALAGSKIGAIFTPLARAMTAIGTGTKALGTGAEKVGQAGQKGFSKMDDFGKKTVQTGNNIVKAGKGMENTAKRMDNIRKYYKAKLLNHVQQKSSNTASLDNQRNMMRLKNPLAFEQMNATKRKQAQTTIATNMALMAQNKKRQK